MAKKKTNKTTTASAKTTAPKAPVAPKVDEVENTETVNTDEVENTDEDSGAIKLKKQHKHKGKMYDAGTDLEELGEVTPSQVSFMRNNGVI